MSTESFSQLLALYSWFPLAALLFFLLLIARLYERFSGEKTQFRLFVIPIVLFGIHVVYQTNQASGDSFIMGLLPAVGGLLLIGLCVHLYRKMMDHT